MKQWTKKVCDYLDPPSKMITKNMTEVIEGILERD